MTQTLAPRFVEGKAMLVAGLGGRYDDSNRAEIPDLWRRFGPRFFGRTPGQVDKRAYGVCSNMDFERQFSTISRASRSRAPKVCRPN